MFNDEPITLITGVGILGVFFYMGSYAALQFGYIQGRGYIYPLLNAIAASLVAISLIEAYNLSSLLIQISWISISIYGIVRVFVYRNFLKFSVEEQNFLDSILPELPREHARPLMNIAKWRDAKEGEVVISEDKPVGNLVYLSQGAAVVSLNGQVFAELEGNHVLGEVTCLRGEPATATVRLTRASRVMLIDSAKLRKFVATNPEVRSHLEQSFNLQIGQKLASTTRQILVEKSQNHGFNVASQIDVLNLTPELASDASD